jgi:large subunit ribosomal protein L19
MDLENTLENKGIVKKETSINYVNLVESKHKRVIQETEPDIEIGDIIRIGYLIPEGNKERTQYYEGLVISRNNRGIGQTFTIRRNVQGVGVEQVFVFNSPKIISVTKKQSSKVRRAKLYFIRGLSGKATRLKQRIK